MDTDLETILIKLRICREKGYKEQYKTYLHDLMIFHPTYYHRMMGTTGQQNTTVVNKNSGDDAVVGSLLGLGAGLLLGGIFFDD